MKATKKPEKYDGKFFIPAPAATSERGRGDTRHCTVYLNSKGQRLLWSASFPLPRIGDRIVITMNGIGPAIVKGYFSEHGYLGVMTRALKPPAWLRKQRKDEAKRTDMPQWWRDGIGCEFGSEIELPTLPKYLAAKANRVFDLASNGHLKGTIAAELKLSLANVERILSTNPSFALTKES